MIRRLLPTRRVDPVVAAEGAMTFLERVSPALEQVDSSSGAIGTAVDRGIAELAPIVAEALAAMGQKAEAVRYAESCRGWWTNEQDINALCEEILLSSSLADEAFERFDLLVGHQ